MANNTRVVCVHSYVQFVFDHGRHWLRAIRIVAELESAERRAEQPLPERQHKFGHGSDMSVDGGQHHGVVSAHRTFSRNTQRCALSLVALFLNISILYYIISGYRVRADDPLKLLSPTNEYHC